MRHSLIIIITFLAMVVLSSCVKNHLMIRHTVIYRATSDTFYFNVSYINGAGQLIDTPVSNGWSRSVVVGDTGFLAKMTVSSFPGHHVIANIIVDDSSVVTESASDGTVTAKYLIGN